MFYDIYLNELPKDDPENKIRTLFARLSCENADYVLKGLCPVIICRYATSEERDFYLSFAKKYNLNMVSKPIRETVFESFDLEIKRNEQDDTHLMNRLTIKEKLKSGLEFLEEIESNESEFTNASDNILSAIRKRNEMLTAKFSPKSIYLTFLIWILFAFGMSLFYAQSTIDFLFSIGCSFVLLMSLSLLGDYLVYRNELRTYFSKSGEDSFWTVLIENNSVKNKSIHTVEDYVDTLTARSKLTVLPVSKRDAESIGLLLQKFDDLSLNEILAAL